MKILAFFAFLAVFSLSSASLQDDLHDIINLVPVEEISEIVRNYIANDPAVQEALAYLQGPEWAKIVETVFANPTWQELNNYFIVVGLDIEVITQAIGDIISGDGSNVLQSVQSIPSSLSIPSIPSIPTTSGLNQMLDDIVAIVPVDDLLALLNDKLENSADLQEFFEAISSDEARALVGDISAIPEVQRIANNLRNMGVDVDQIIDLVSRVLGWD